MKSIEIDDELYQYIVKNTEKIGESASSILRRLLSLEQQLIQQNSINVDITENEIGDSNKSNPINIEVDISSSDNSSKNIYSADYLFNYINREELAMQRGVVGRFLLILAALNRVHPENFAAVTEIRGKGRLYFAKNSDDLEASGSSTKPKQIAESQFWVITNTNTTRKKMMLTDVAKELGYNQEDAEKIRELL